MEQSGAEGPGRLKIAGVQMDVRLGAREENLARIEHHLRQAAAAGARLVIFPECALCGYCIESLEEARPHAEAIPGPSTRRLEALCRELDVFAVVGLLEADGEKVFNACVLIGPAGIVGAYRKLHLPYLGVDRFTTPGDRPPDVYDADGVRVGMGICYDASFPEAARVLALRRADLIALPTNWPPGAECTARFVINTRAMENHVYFAAVNRVGSERGLWFIGQSKICDPSGEVLAQAGAGEEIVYAEIEPALARRKRVVRVPGKHEIDRFADRRPEMYAPLLAPVSKERDMR